MRRNQIHYLIISLILFAWAMGWGSGAPAIKNPSFEEGLQNWTVKYSARTYATNPCQVVAGRALDGSNAVCINSISRYSPIRIEQDLLFATVATGRFEVTCFVYPENRVLGGNVNLMMSRDFDKFNIDTDLLQDVVMRREMTNGWIKYTIRFANTYPSAKAVLSVANYTGKVWVDRFSVEPVEESAIKEDGIWYYDIMLRQKDGGDGMKPRNRFQQMLAGKSPFIDRAKKYNDLLTDAAFLQDQSARIERANTYRGARQDGGELKKQLESLWQGLDKLNKEYTTLYWDNTATQLSTAIDPQLSALERQRDQLRQALDQGWRDIQATASRDYASWPRPPEPDLKKLCRIDGQGVPNQPIFGTWGKAEFREVAPRMGVWEFHSAVGPTLPLDKPDGTLDWMPFLSCFEDLKKQGCLYFGVRTLFFSGNCSNNKTPIPRSFREKYRKTPDVFLTENSVNYYHPLVREMLLKEVADMARQLRGHPDILFYLYCWESFGLLVVPEDAKDPATCSSLAAFHTYLEQRYGTIAQLNSKWKTEFKSFREILPARHQSANKYDYQRFIQTAYIEILRELYQAIKKEDPNTAVFADHSGLAGCIDPTHVFETCDILANHGENSIWWDAYAASNAKLTGKNVGCFEGWPVLQEEKFRLGDQKALYASEAKYALRKALFGQEIQSICFPYTSQKGGLWTQGQWAQTSTDYTLLNYFATSIPVVISRIKALGEVLVSTRMAPADLLVVFPQTSYFHELGGGRKDIRNMASLLHQIGRSFEFRSEERLIEKQESLANYKAIIFPYGHFLGEGVSDQLLDWVRKGGLLISIGSLGNFDAYGFDDGRLMKEVLGFVPKINLKPWIFEYDFREAGQGSELIVKNIGQGQVAFVTVPFGQFIENPAQFEKLLELLDRHAPPFATTPGNVFEFWNLTDSKGNRYLGVLNANPDVAVQSEVRLRGDFRHVTDWDLPGGFPVALRRRSGETRFDLKLAPADMTVLKLESGWNWRDLWK